MAAPKTVLTYPLDGTNRDFPIPFEYLARKFVVVTLVGATRKVLAVTTDYRFTTRSNLTTSKAWGPGDGFETIELRRVTSATDRLVDFSDGSILRAYDLNTSQVQSLHIAEEARDLTADTIAVNNDGDLDARGRRIVNLADATQPDHAVTLRQEQAWAASTLGNANLAVERAANAKLSAEYAYDRANAAAKSETNSKASEDSAKASAKVATDEIAKINNQVEVAKGHAERSEERAANAKLSAEYAYDRANASERYADASIKAKDLSEAAAVRADSAALQLGMSTWGYRPVPFKGFALDDGQELERALYPDFVKALDSGALPWTTEADWQANPYRRACFVPESSPGKFRMRDLNGTSVGSIGAVFLRGHRGGPGDNGVFRDQMQDFRITMSNGGAGGSVIASRSSAAYEANGNTMTYENLFSKVAGTAGIPRFGQETYPTHATGAWMTRLYGKIGPLGAAEASSLATAYASMASRLGVVEGRIAQVRAWESPTALGLAAGQVRTVVHNMGIAAQNFTFWGILKAAQNGYPVGTNFRLDLNCEVNYAKGLTVFNSYGDSFQIKVSTANACGIHDYNTGASAWLAWSNIDAFVRVSAL
ncbi:hypothetical protein GV819_15800 [Pseudomonas sp. Fl5BN2]|uniref:phage tail fiber domain-containing protein n=1 Tax=Pseudomonas sp. Fl5BN2 TaxID=2697652 RepID=UPI001376AD4B|nr:phage tail fiber protein [Pseudomonas sp. Fl5BN2]NBF03757.1 hypothetical protein [Pseudomonas sp. Fl5BN2]